MVVERLDADFVARCGARHGAGSHLRKTFLAGCALAVVALLPGVARAQIGSDRYSSIVVDSNTGAVLSSSSADELRYPASLTKMMTLYMAFEAIRDRRISLDQLVPVSDHAASMSPTKLGLVPGTEITVEQAILGLVTLSANDAASALGELMGGSEDRFAQMMTLRARALGMSRTTFENASGLPDPDQLTTARDMAMLARHLIRDFPAEYHYFSTPNFVFHGRTIWNHDRMLQTYPGADGLKTGFTNASGHNLVTSALRSDTRLIGVVMGAASNPERDRHMAALLDRGFEAEGVPVLLAHRDVPMHLALIPTAHAAELDEAQPPVTVHMAAAFSHGKWHHHPHGHPAGHVAEALPGRRISALPRDVEVAEAPLHRRASHRHQLAAASPAPKPGCAHHGCGKGKFFASR